MPSAVTISRFSTPARMIKPYRVKRRKASSPPSTSTAAMISSSPAFGTFAPRIEVTSRVHAGRGNGRGSAPQVAWSSATPASDRPTVTSTCSMVRE